MSGPGFCALRRAFALGVVLAAAGVPAGAQSRAAASQFPAENVGVTSVPLPVDVTVRRDGVLQGMEVVPHTATGSDFQIVPGGTCRSGQIYRTGNTCSVTVTFRPAYAGVANGRILLRSTTGEGLGSAPLRATALGSVFAFTPGTVSPVLLGDTPAKALRALAADSAGNLYFAEAETGTVLRVDAASGDVSTVSAGAGVSGIRAMAATDESLDLLLDNNAVLRVDLASGASTPVVLGIPADAFTAIAADSHGRVLLAQSTRVLRIDNGNATVLAGGDSGSSEEQFTSVAALDVDAEDNLYVADAGAARILRIDATTSAVTTVAGTGAPCRHGECGDGGPAASASFGVLLGITVDPLGNLYTLERGHGLRRIDAATGTIAPVLPANAAPLRGGAFQLAAARDGSIVLLSSNMAGTPQRFSAASSALSFSKTPVGQTSEDGAQTVTLTNLGSAPLSLDPPTAGSNPSTGSDFPLATAQTCPQLSSTSAAGTLAPGERCSIQVKFQPTVAGDLSGSVVVTGSDTGSAARHSIAVRGLAVAAPAQQASVAVTALPASPVYGQPVTLVTTVYANSSSSPTPTGTVNFTEGTIVLAQNVALSNGLANFTVTLPDAGAHTYTATYSGDSNYAAPAQGSTTSITVTRARSVFTLTLGTYTVGQSVTANFVLSGQYSGTGIALPSGNVTYQVLDSTGAIVTSGSAAHQDRVNSVDETAAIGAVLKSGNYTLRLIYPGDSHFFPLQQDYPLTIQALQQTITFAPIPSPVTYGTPPIPLSATASSGLPVTFSVLSGPGAIVNNQLVVTGIGTIVVAANQAGNSDYDPAQQVTQTVVSVRPVARLNWPTPAPITIGTPLSSTQLNATATDGNGQPVAGTYVYTPPAGTVLPLGNNTLSVAFTPADTQHYGNVTVTASVTLLVRQTVTPVVTFAGGTVAFGSSLAGVLQATATYNGAAVPGTFTFTTGTTVLTAATVLPVGSYPVTVAFTPADTTTYRSATAAGTIVIVKGATALTLTSSASPVFLNNAVTFTASLVTRAIAPTGTVQFQSGTTVLGTALLSANGTAAITIATLPSGTQTIIATYSGDGNYSAATATLTEVVADFTFALASSSKPLQSVLPAATATYTFTLAPAVTSTLVGDITLAVTGLPTGAKYTLTPATVAAGSSTTTVTLTVTAPVTLKAQARPSPHRGEAAGLVLAVLALPFAARLRRRSQLLRHSGTLSMALLAGLALLSAVGCGNGVGYFDQSQLTFPLTVTANSGALSHSAPVTFQVQ